MRSSLGGVQPRESRLIRPGLGWAGLGGVSEWEWGEAIAAALIGAETKNTSSGRGRSAGCWLLAAGGAACGVRWAWAGERLQRCGGT